MKLNRSEIETEFMLTFYEVYNLFEIILKFKTNQSLSLKESFILTLVDALKPKNENIISNIADILQIRNPSASIAISTLVKKGFLERRPSSEDRRLIYLELTSKANRILIKQNEFRARAIERISSELNVIEKASLVTIFKKIRKFVHEDTQRIKKDKTPVI
jgi:DNA-binding MarR family transcriptional regulator